MSELVEIAAKPVEEIGDASPKGFLNQLTVAHGLFVCVLFSAAVLRFTALQNVALSPGEASEAYAVWRFWQPGTGGGVNTVSSAYFTATSLLVPVLGESAAIMRLVPALFGMGLVALPWAWRTRLGNVGALTASTLLAISPTASMIARTAGGQSIALLAALLLLISWERLRGTGHARWLYLASASIGLGLCSGPLFLGGGATLTLAWLAQRRFGPRVFIGQEGSTSGQLDIHWRHGLIVGVVTFLAVGTFFLWRPAGIGAVASSAGTWLSTLGQPGNLVARLSPLMAFVRYEPLILILGAGATLWASWRGYPLPVFLVYLIAAGSLLVLIQPRAMGNTLLLVVPGSLLIGLWLEDLFETPGNWVTWIASLLVFALGAVTYFNGARYLRVVVFGTGQSRYLMFAILPVVIGAVIINFMRNWDERAAWQGALIGVFGLFVVFHWGSAWWLTHQAANDPRERWVQTATDDDVLLLVNTLAEVSRQLTGSGQDLDLVVSLESPVLDWYLREYNNVRVGSTVAPDTISQAIITAAGTDPTFGSDYFGTDFGLMRTGSIAENPDTTPSVADTIRWWLFRETPDVIAEEHIILWVRNDALK